VVRDEKENQLFSCFFIVSGASFISKKIKEQGFFRKSHQKKYPLDPGSGKNSSRIRILDPGGKKAPDPGPATLFRPKQSAAYLSYT
jgi:hypothetical protein